MKKSLLSFVCILSLGLSCVFGEEMGKGKMNDGAMPKMGGKFKHSMNQFAKEDFVNDLKGYVDAYQYFKAIANTTASNKSAQRAVKVAQRIVKHQDKFIQKLKGVAQKLKNIDSFRELGDKINTQLMENNARMAERAKNDMLEASQGNKAALWESIRRNKEDIHSFKKRVHRFIKHLHHKMKMMKNMMNENVVVLMDDNEGEDNDVDETGLAIFEDSDDDNQGNDNAQ